MRAVERFLSVLRFCTRYLRRTYRGTVHYARERKRDRPLADKTVLFESYRAVKIADTPLAMFEEMLSDPSYRDFTFIWAIDDRDNPYRRRFSHDPRVRFVRFHSRAYARALWTAKYVVNNKAWPAYFTRRPGQVHVTTWHATAFKALGKEQGGTIGQFKNVTRNYIQADYLVMPNRFTSEVMLRSNDVRGIFPGLVLEEGYPRTDLTLKADRREVLALLERVSGVDPAKRIVLYAPTWRGETGGYADTTQEAIDHVRELAEGLPHDHELVLKVHDLTYRHLAGRSDLAGIKYVPDWVDTNELLAAVDVLVTDYSSIFFDMLVLDRPVIFFAYDLDDYILDRGLYFDMHALPGPLCHTAAEVLDAIRDLDSVKERYAASYARMREEYCPGSDGLASKRVCDAVFKGASAASAYRSFDEGKTRVLVAGCAFDGDSQTFEVVNMSRHLDYDRYDLSVLFIDRVTPERERCVRMLDPRTRVFYSPGYHPLTFGELLRWDAHRTLPAPMRCAREELDRMRPYYERERRRLLGDTPFDVVISFTGEVNKGTCLIAACEFPKRVLWLAQDVDELAEPLPVELITSRFSQVVYASEVEESRLVRALRRADGAGSPRPVKAERFAGYDASIASFVVETRAQLKMRTRALLAERAYAAGAVTDAVESERLDAVFDEAFCALAEGLTAHVSAAHAMHGLDPGRRNRTIMDTFYDVTSPTGAADTGR